MRDDGNVRFQSQETMLRDRIEQVWNGELSITAFRHWFSTTTWHLPAGSKVPSFVRLYLAVDSRIVRYETTDYSPEQFRESLRWVTGRIYGGVSSGVDPMSTKLGEIVVRSHRADAPPVKPQD